ncbi:MAG: vitamin B12 dependent-methionine synthase activation domain-containing protein, partial [Cyanobacteria bacterium P01_H01_bin.130]
FMKDNLQTFNERGIQVPVILGGAALTPNFVRKDCQSVYNGRVIYGKDAFADLNFMDKLMPAKKGGNWEDTKGFLDEVDAADLNGAAGTVAAEPVEKKPKEPVPIDTRRSEAVSLDVDRPTPPFWGTRILQGDEIPLEEAFWHLDLQALLAGQWQFRKPREKSKEEHQAFLQEKVHPILARWKQRVVAEKLLHPQVVYGYFPCNAEGNTVYVYDHEAIAQGADIATLEPVTSFEFPRQRSNRRLCIADFFATRESGQVDVFPMQAATVGDIATEFAQTLFAADQYTDYLYFHGLAVQTAEALAEWTHARVRRELGYGDLEPDNIRDMLVQKYQGSRYSFGYPACPNMQDQFKQLDLLKTDRINMYMD